VRIREVGEDCANPGVETGFGRAISDPPVEGVERRSFLAEGSRGGGKKA
jgi:hypothetical protein